MIRLDHKDRNGNARGPVRRVLNVPLDYRAVTRERDDLVVTLYPNGLLGFRPLRRRREVTLSIGAAYVCALKQEAERARKERGTLRKGKKGTGV